MYITGARREGHLPVAYIKGGKKSFRSLIIILHSVSLFFFFFHMNHPGGSFLDRFCSICTVNDGPC